MKHLERIRVRAASAFARSCWRRWPFHRWATPQARRGALYKNPSAPVEQRVEDLLSRMTQEEKIAQITTVWTRKNAAAHRAERQPRSGESESSSIRTASASSCGRRICRRPALPRRRPIAMRSRPSRSSTRSRSGRSRARGSAFPRCFTKKGCMASRRAAPRISLRPSGWQARGIQSCSPASLPSSRARFARAALQLVLAPVVDVGRDPRWGRIEETYGEDPYLVGELGVAAVRGFQGDSAAARQRPCARDAEAHDRSRPAGRRHQRRPGEHLRARAARILLSRPSKLRSSAATRRR